VASRVLADVRKTRPLKQKHETAVRHKPAWDFEMCSAAVQCNVQPLSRATNVNQIDESRSIVQLIKFGPRIYELKGAVDARIVFAKLSVRILATAYATI
jgi:hypothetical protein